MEQMKKYVWAFVDVNQCGPYRFEVVKTYDDRNGCIPHAVHELVGDTSGGYLQFRKPVDQCYETVNECFEAAKTRLNNEIACLQEQLETLQMQLRMVTNDEHFWRRRDYVE